MTLLKSCRCGKKIEYHIKLCDDCMAEDKERIQRYDREIRHSDSNKRYTDFYNSKAWIVMSQVVKVKHEGLCVVCEYEGRFATLSDTTHHIEELKERWDLRLTEGNLIPLCHECHNKLHANYSDKEKKYLKKLIKKLKINKKINLKGGGAIKKYDLSG